MKRKLWFGAAVLGLVLAISSYDPGNGYDLLRVIRAALRVMIGLDL